jgi:beta-glucosidase
MAQVNNEVRHVLTLKYLAGMFQNPITDPTRVKTAELTPANVSQARTAADESMVLLNNQKNALPLSTSTPSIAVVGPLADDALDQLGPDVPIGYDTSTAGLAAGGGDKIVTVKQGIQNALPHATVNYAPGCTTFTVTDPCNETTGFSQAVTAAQASDVTVVVVGEPAGDSGEASSRSMIDLPGSQLQLIQQIAATNKPYVVVLMNGRPLTIPWLADNAPGLLEAWYPGTEGGDAVADVLFGKVDPGGKLPISFPRNVGQIPISYNELPTGRPADPNNKYTSKYLDVDNTPQYPFGYGLSYTTFNVGAPQLSSGSVSPNGRLRVTVPISNTGSVTGDDVVQLYLHQDFTSILQPVRKLEGFQRVSVPAGQSTTVTFTLNRQNFGFYNDQGQFVIEPGQFHLWVGDSSVGDNETTFNVG